MLDDDSHLHGNGRLVAIGNLAQPDQGANQLERSAWLKFVEPRATQRAGQPQIFLLAQNLEQVVCVDNERMPFVRWQRALRNGKSVHHVVGDDEVESLVPEIGREQPLHGRVGPILDGGTL